MTDLTVSGLADGEALDTGQVVETAGVLVTTHETFSAIISRKHLALEECRLVIVDNVQASFDRENNLKSLYSSVARNKAPRLVTITPNILSSNTDPGLSSLPFFFLSMATCCLWQLCVRWHLPQSEHVCVMCSLG